jgi:hypothetical protein
MHEFMTEFMAAELRRFELETLAGTRGRVCHLRQELARQPRQHPGRMRGWMGRCLIHAGERLCAAQEPVTVREKPALQRGR